MLFLLALAWSPIGPSKEARKRRLEDDDHDHGSELCGCAAHEPDHPFTIDCANGAAIREAYANLMACEDNGAATEAACAVDADADGVMECQVAFFVLQAHHDYCSHDTLTREEEEYVHVWEASCLKCGIERQYDRALMDCPTVNCADTQIIDAAYWIVNTTCIAADNSVEYEWGGSFETPADSYKWVSQPTGDNAPYAWVDPAMKMVFLPSTSATEAALYEASGPVGTADQLMVGTCTDVNSGDTVTPTASGCFNFLFSGQDDFTATINTAGVSNLFIFAQHVPTEFERDTHYLLDMADTDIEPVASVGAPAGHDHRRLSQAVETPAGRRRLGSLGSCCNNDHQIGAFRQIVAYHDLCDHDDIPMYVEVGLHDYEASCEDHFCNAVPADYDGALCPAEGDESVPEWMAEATAAGWIPCSNSVAARKRKLATLQDKGVSSRAISKALSKLGLDEDALKAKTPAEKARERSRRLSQKVATKVAGDDDDEFMQA